MPAEEMEVVGHDALQSITAAEVRSQTAIARQFPRNVKKVVAEALTLATETEDIAKACMYGIPRAGKVIQGPSVRLAEIFATTWEHLRVFVRTVSVRTDGEFPMVTVAGFAHDVQANSVFSVEKTRSIHRKYDREGNPMPVTPDDITLAINSCTAFAYRDAVFKAVPKAYVNRVLDQCKSIAVGNAQTFATKRAACIEDFERMGVTPAMILSKLVLPNVEAITQEHLLELVGYFNAIRGSDDVEPVPIESIFPPAQAAQTAQATPGGPPQGTPAAATTAGAPASPAAAGGIKGGAGRRTKTPAAATTQAANPAPSGPPAAAAKPPEQPPKVVNTPPPQTAAAPPDPEPEPGGDGDELPFPGPAGSAADAGAGLSEAQEALRIAITERGLSFEEMLLLFSPDHMNWWMVEDMPWKTWADVPEDKATAFIAAINYVDQGIPDFRKKVPKK